MLINVRIFFKKLNDLKYISHLDLNRCFLRSMKKSKLPFWYTKGFNPHIYITFNTPLSLGINSTCESVDARLTETISFDNIINALNDSLPKDIRVYSVCFPSNKASDICNARYEIKNIKVENINNLKDFLNSENIITEKKTKKGLKEVDLKDFITEYNFKMSEDNEEYLDVVLACGGTKNLNPFLLMNTFNEKYGLPLNGQDITKTAVYIDGMVEFI